MDKDELEMDETYTCDESFEACAWDEKQCAMGDQLKIQKGTMLTYAYNFDENTFIFTLNGTPIALHANDLVNLSLDQED